MDKITHLWNVNQLVTKLDCPQRINLQTHYITKCRRFSKGIQLPSKNFGPSTMCPYCGSLWNTIDHTVRLLKGKPVSKSVKKIVNSMENRDKNVPKVQRSLAEKCLKNRMNKLVLKCSVCSNSTKIPFNKPQRERMQKNSSVQKIQKKKKRKNKDKTAGLNISGISNLTTEDVTEGSKDTMTRKMGNTNFIKTPQKLKKLNINRLKDIVNQGATPPKKNSLHSFLAEIF
ncbi:uncharacterized protein LOC108622914 [Ceratina calcarata]|uniref:Uncharacterized protein LOC108622914 n=1 Tax=Ceratina calcarata TaxID=156304 RepID=A0AAJ7N4I7_9HYME|nr:uncharacterized protein LOC108622914 [Ceratina calcarata]